MLSRKYVVPGLLPLLMFAASTAIVGQSAQAGARIAQDIEIEVHPKVGKRRLVLHADAERQAIGLEVFRPGTATAAQHLPVETTEPPAGNAPPQVIVEDLDGDGYLDLRVLSWWGATGNAGFIAWRYDVPNDRYVEIPGFAQLSQPRVEAGTRCLRTRSNGGHAGLLYVIERWCWRGTTLDVVWAQQQSSPRDDRYLRVTSERRGGRMVEIERRELTLEALERERAAEEASTRKPRPRGSP